MRKGFVGLRLVAVLVIEAKVAGDLRVELLGAGRKRRFGVDHRGQIAILGLDLLRGVLRRERRACDNQGHFLADEADAAVGEPVAVRHFDRRPAPAGITRDLRRRFESGSGGIGAGEYRGHAGRALGRPHFDRGDFGVRAVRAQEIAVKLAREVPVRSVFALPREEPQILAPAPETRTHRFISGWIQKCAQSRVEAPSTDRMKGIRYQTVKQRRRPYCVRRSVYTWQPCFAPPPWPCRAPHPRRAARSSRCRRRKESSRDLWKR